ncbi:uncharacterized protein LOC111075713 [Drosophila obscura]|uniref:uncharacterized protein LOC111075713 n=1 Tax=Drosophila obscura TaxID=7282 RepID=UPI001BB0D81E|nr:uncharacterized protein LOC111075713 [Drosophila obscura]
MAITKCDDRYKPGNLKAPKIHPKSKAATKVKCNKDAQPKPQGCAEEKSGNKDKTVLLADKAREASKAAETILAGKKQLLDALENSLCGIKKVLGEMKNSAASSSCAAKLVKRIRNTEKKNVANLKSLYGQVQVSLEKIRSVAENAQREAMEKRKLQQTAKRRVQILKKGMEEMQADLERTRASAKKANCAAKRAKERVHTIHTKKDMQSLSKFLQRRRRGSQTQTEIVLH